jgi:hypothetical protein
MKGESFLSTKLSLSHYSYYYRILVGRVYIKRVSGRASAHSSSSAHPDYSSISSI